MTARLAAHWTVTTILAASTATATSILPPPYGGWAGALAAAGVCMAGLATAPHITRKDGRS